MLFSRSICCAVVLSAALIPFFTSAATLSIGHRGNSLYAPENTISAFLACNGKADLVECDTRVSSDGTLVIMHDATVDRTTDGTGSVGSLTLAQLKGLDAGSWFSSAFTGEPIPTLEEMVTNTVPFATPLIEQKTGSAAQHVDVLRRLNALTNVVVQSFDWNFLAGVHALEPSIPLCALGSGTLTTSSLTTITNAGCGTVAWAYGNIGSNEVALVHSWGLKLFVWTVNNRMAIQNFIDMGVDGIISDDPAAVLGIQEPPVTNAPTYLGDRLIAYWKLDDGLTNAFTTTVSDSKGANTGSLVRNDGLSHWFDNSTAKLDGCLQVAGNSAYVNLPSNATLNINTNEVTISAWVRLQNLPAQLPESFGGIFDSVEDCYVFYLDKGNNELRFKITDSNNHAARPGISAAFLPLNQWIHVAATYNGSAYPTAGQSIIYLNGELADSHIGHDNTVGAGLTANVKTGQIAAIGRNGTQSIYPFSGMVDDLAIWKRALNPEEIQSLYQGGQEGMNLDALLRLPTPLIDVYSIKPNPAGTSVEITFRNLGPWQTFKLVHADACTGPYSAVEGLAPVALGDGHYRFVYPLDGSNAQYFRVQGE